MSSSKDCAVNAAAVASSPNLKVLCPASLSTFSEPRLKWKRVCTQIQIRSPSVLKTNIVSNNKRSSHFILLFIVVCLLCIIIGVVFVFLLNLYFFIIAL